MNYSVYPPNWYLDYPVRTRLGCTPGESVARFPGHQRNQSRRALEDAKPCSHKTLC